MKKTVSEDISKKLSRYGWQKLQTEKMYIKRHNVTIYDLVASNNYAYGFDAPNIAELKKMASLISFQSDFIDANEYAISLIEFCKKNKIKLSNFQIGMFADCL